MTEPESISQNGGYLEIPSKVFWYDEWYDVVAIEQKAFENVSALRVVTFPNSLKTIKRNAFSGCSLTDLTFPGSVQDIQPHAFMDNPIEELILEEGPLDIYIPKSAIDFDKITYAYLGREFILGGKMTNLVSLTLGNSVTEVPAVEFQGLTNLTQVTLGSSIVSIGKSAFEGCPIGNLIYLPPALESIGDRAFADSAVKTVYMGSALKKIGNSAFEGCNLQQIYISAEWPPLLGENAFSDYTWSLHVQGKLDEYKWAPGWKDAKSTGSMIPISKMEYSGPDILTGETGSMFDLSHYVKTIPSGRYLFWKSTDLDIATVTTDGVVTLQNGIADPDAECEIICETIDADAPVVKVKVSGNKYAGVDEIPFGAPEQTAIDYSAPYAVYTLDGRVAGHSVDGLAKGIYVIRQNNNAKKFIAK